MKQALMERKRGGEGIIGGEEKGGKPNKCEMRKRIRNDRREEEIRGEEEKKGERSGKG